MPSAHKVKMGMAYNGPPFVTHHAKIDPKAYRSMTEEIPYSSSSSMSYHDGAYYFKTANRTHGPFFKGDIKRYGLATHWEDSAQRMNDWKANSESNPSINHDVMPARPDIMYFKGHERKLSLPDPTDTKVSLYVTPDYPIVSLNNMGKYISMAHDFEMMLKDRVFETGKNYVEITHALKKYDKYGFNVQTANTNGIRGIGIDVDVEGKGFLANYRPVPGWFAINRDLAEYMKRYPDKDVREAVLTSLIAHELGHTAGVPGSGADENLQGRILHEIYSELAAGSSGRKKVIYEKLAKYESDYAEHFSLANRIKRSFKSSSFRKIDRYQALAAIMRREGIEIGLTGRALQNYINSRMADDNGATLFRESADGDNLESKLNDDRIGITLTEDGKIAPTFNGKRVYGEGASSESRFLIKDYRGKQSEEPTYEDGNKQEYTARNAPSKPRKKAEKSDDKGHAKGESTIDPENYQSMSDAKENSKEAAKAETAAE